MPDSDLRRFLWDLAVQGRVAASTRKQAFNALLFLYRDVFERKDLDWGLNYFCSLGSRRKSVCGRIINRKERRDHIERRTRRRGARSAVRQRRRTEDGLPRHGVSEVDGGGARSGVRRWLGGRRFRE